MIIVLLIILIETYDDLHKWSCKNYSTFWNEFWTFSKIRYSSTFTSVVDESVSIDGIPKWFIGAKLNYSENLLENGAKDDIAVYYTGTLFLELELEC